MLHVGLVQSLSSTVVGASGVALPVPRNRAAIGNTTVLANSSEKRNIFINILSGIRAKNSNQWIKCSMVANRLTSFWCFASSPVGNTVLQNFSSLPQDTLSTITTSYRHVPSLITCISTGSAWYP
jgi:hypothetical protein